MSGAAGAAAAIINPRVSDPVAVFALSDIDVGGSPLASVTFNTDGSLSNTGSDNDVAASWYTRVITGIGSGYWIRMTKNSGDSPTSGTLNTWQQLSSARTWEWDMANAEANVKLEIATDSGGSNIVATNSDIPVSLIDGTL